LVALKVVKKVETLVGMMVVGMVGKKVDWLVELMVELMVGLKVVH